MKKIININLAGRVIPIEDSAYEKLQSYIESLRRYFAHEDGRDEIINDIESRIAELMNEKVRKGASSVTEADIEEIIASMGRPEDFEAEEAAEKGNKSQAGQSDDPYTGTKKRRTRLYRNMSDRFLGGVCSGVANSLNVDPAIIRLLFAIITFGGFGFGIVLYILLWIILPAKPLEAYSGKRLFRNPDDRIIGGVAGGLAAYFHKEAWIIRLIFAAPLLVNILVSIFTGAFYGFEPFPSILFGSISGTFLLAYIILWIVLPEARSSYEKMEMRGEKVDVNTIRQNVQEGMGQIKTRAEEFGQEVKTAAQNFGARAKEFADTRGKTFVSEVSQTAKPIGSGIGRAIGILFKAFFIIVAGSIAFGLFIGLMTLIFSGVGLFPFKNFLLDGFWQNLFAWGTLLLFLGVPLVAFITWLVRRVMRVKSQSHYLGWIFGGLWTLGWICVTFLVSSIFRDLRNYERVEENISIQQPVNGKMIVKVNEPEVRFGGNYWWFDGNDGGWDIDEDSLRMSNIKLRIAKSDDSAYHVKTYKYSAGKNRTDAQNRASKTQFNTHYQDSILDVGSRITIGKDSKFRGQEVIVEVQVPVGKKIRFDESIAEKLHPYTIRLKENYGRNRNWNRRSWHAEFDFDHFFDWDVNTDYIMGSDGVLVNPDKPKAKPGNNNDHDYRYNEKERKRIEYEEQKRKAEEEQLKLKQLENELKRDTVILKQEKPEESEELMGSTNSPVFSLATMFY